MRKVSIVWTRTALLAITSTLVLGILAASSPATAPGSAETKLTVSATILKRATLKTLERVLDVQQVAVVLFVALHLHGARRRCQRAAQLLELADQALYKAKRSGRDQVWSAVQGDAASGRPRPVPIRPPGFGQRS